MAAIRRAEPALRSGPGIVAGLAALTLALTATAQAADERPCPAAHDALDAAYGAAEAVEQNAGNVVFKLMPAALSAEKAAGQAEAGGWPQSIIDIFAGIAGEARDLAASPDTRTPEAAQTLQGHAEAGEADIAPICGARN